MTNNWLGQLARTSAWHERWRRLVAAATTADRSLDRWDGWQVSATRRRDLDDLAAMRAAGPGRR